MIQLNVTKEASDATDGMNLGILAHIEKIVELSENSELNNEFFEKAKPHIDLLKKRLQLNDMQVVLLSHFIDKARIIVFISAKFLKLSDAVLSNCYNI